MFSARADSFSEGARKGKVRGQRMLIDLSALFSAGRRAEEEEGRRKLKRAISRWGGPVCARLTRPCRLEWIEENFGEKGKARFTILTESAEWCIKEIRNCLRKRAQKPHQLISPLVPYKFNEAFPRVTWRIDIDSNTIATRHFTVLGAFMGKKPKGEKLSYDGWVDRGIRFFFVLFVFLSTRYFLYRGESGSHTHTLHSNRCRTHTHTCGETFTITRKSNRTQNKQKGKKRKKEREKGRVGFRQKTTNTYPWTWLVFSLAGRRCWGRHVTKKNKKHKHTWGPNRYTMYF